MRFLARDLQDNVNLPLFMPKNFSVLCPRISHTFTPGLQYLVKFVNGNVLASETLYLH
jgi:hypothetical protein